MKKKTLLMICALIIFCAVPAFTEGKTTEDASPLMLERYQKCVHGKDCTTQERWAIIEDMADEMHLTQLLTQSMCRNSDMNNDCLRVQKTEREERQRIHTHMRKKIRSAEHKSFWKKIVN